jgi:hypothetical protein
VPLEDFTRGKIRFRQVHDQHNFSSLHTIAGPVLATPWVQLLRALEHRICKGFLGFGWLGWVPCRD